MPDYPQLRKKTLIAAQKSLALVEDEKEPKEASKKLVILPGVEKTKDSTPPVANAIKVDVESGDWSLVQRKKMTRNKLKAKYQGHGTTGRRRHRETNGIYPKECLLCNHEEDNNHMPWFPHTNQSIHMQNLYIDLAKLQDDMKSDRHFHATISFSIFQCQHNQTYTPNIRLHDRSVLHLT